MSSETGSELVLAIHLQTRGFAYCLFERWTTPVDWAVHDVRGSDKNELCRKRVESVLRLHTPDVVLLQAMSGKDSNRALRIKRLNKALTALAERQSLTVRTYSRTAIREAFASHFGANTKQRIAETIARHIPALQLYLPPARKPWMSEHERMGMFEAAALGWMYFHAG
jgi:hypothetical protein